MRKPRLKEAVQVLSREYQVKYGKLDEEFGNCCRIGTEITIDPEQCSNSEQIRRTFYHEIAHAFAWESGLTSAGITGNAEELFAEAMASFLYTMNGGKLPWERK